MPVAWSEVEAGAASFLGVVPPLVIVNEVRRIRTEVDAAISLVAHVTVKAQPNLEAPDLWRPAVRAALAMASPFDVTLGPVRWFGNGIVFLAVSDEMLPLHRLLLDAVRTISDGERFEYEGPDYVPHLTLGAVFAGDTRRQLQQIAVGAAAVRWETFAVTEIVEFRREAGAAEYLPVDSYPLASG